MTDQILAGTRVVTPSDVLEPGWVQIRGGRIAGVGAGAPPRDGTPIRDLGGGWLLPGFVDIHVHGGGGVSAIDSPADLAATVAFHRLHGTTRTLISLVSSPMEQMARAAGWVADLMAREPGLAGAHLEGPFLSRLRCGAHDPDHLRAPATAELRKLLEAGRGGVRMVTVAPELPGGLDLVRELVACDVIAAVGHTDGDYATCRAAFEAGARVLTHTFNGMRGLHHREPGPFLAACDSPDVVLEVINDGIHLADPVVRLIVRQAPDRVALITDASAGAGMGDGRYARGARQVQVSAGRAELVGSGSLAGSTLTMAQAVRRAVREVGLPVTVASAAASAVPARLLGLDCGRIEAGRAAEFVVMTDDFEVREVLAH
ncbi:N-acetylglucosamine-6-phosphate deacetylase [Nonomuraea turcica]|uniref:N-acetylglucosamine-6-phosphate deacetylase n=1 Tax=Nonomuraea sp. G32 TaxID=3067274 RepID=UPI00273B9AD8|nr:N-acetylglucosamine-6-phosphate deacetylase [Nonomuraea sp. G32]MDP4503402.1 N-acetylglucosamine-6-phosphate deacetylase [Nonomuraea sp. G32]